MSSPLTKSLAHRHLSRVSPIQLKDFPLRYTRGSNESPCWCDHRHVLFIPGRQCICQHFLNAPIRGLVLVNSAVRHKCGKIRENAPTVPQSDGSSLKRDTLFLLTGVQTIRKHKLPLFLKNTVRSKSHREYIKRFSLPDGDFLACDHVPDFWHQLICENSINQSNQKIKRMGMTMY